MWDNAHVCDIVFDNQRYSDEKDTEKSHAAAARRPRDVGKYAGCGLQERGHHVRPQADQQGFHHQVEHQGQGQQQDQRSHNTVLLKLWAVRFKL